MAKEKTPQFFCATKASVGNRRCQWPRGYSPTWTVQKSPPQFRKTEYKDICQMAFSAWESVCGITYRYTTGKANIVITTRSIDGRGGVLAEAQLPCQRVTDQTELGLWVDITDQWAYAENPPGGVLDILRVLIHEVAHNNGVDHAPQRSRQIMAPTVSSIRMPQPGFDIDEHVIRYGERIVTPTPELPGGELCGGLIGLLGNDKERFSLDDIGVWLERGRLLWEHRDEIRELIECFSKLSQEERVKRLGSMKRLRDQLIEKTGTKTSK